MYAFLIFLTHATRSTHLIPYNIMALILFYEHSAYSIEWDRNCFERRKGTTWHVMKQPIAPFEITNTHLQNTTVEGLPLCSAGRKEYEIRGFYVGENLNCRFLGTDAVYSCKWLPKFHRNLPNIFGIEEDISRRTGYMRSMTRPCKLPTYTKIMGAAAGVFQTLVNTHKTTLRHTQDAPNRLI
jgi:hypothetical protein